MKYFVLKPKGDDIYAKASRQAMRSYAQQINKENPELADELREWADDCTNLEILGNNGQINKKDT